MATAAAYIAKSPEMMQTIPRELLCQYTTHRDLFSVDEHVMQVKRAVLGACAEGKQWVHIPISFMFHTDIWPTQNKVSQLFSDCDVHWCGCHLDDNNTDLHWDIYVRWGI